MMTRLWGSHQGAFFIWIVGSSCDMELLSGGIGGWDLGDHADPVGVAKRKKIVLRKRFEGGLHRVFAVVHMVGVEFYRPRELHLLVVGVAHILAQQAALEGGDQDELAVSLEVGVVVLVI